MIAACGMLEIALHSEGAQRQYWQDAALQLVKTHVEAFANWDEAVDAVMCYGTVAYHFDRQNTHLCYTDYYLTEALYRLKGYEREIW
jgi:unsaturated chondroitin disaccharide hydrolase